MCLKGINLIAYAWISGAGGGKNLPFRQYKYLVSDNVFFQYVYEHKKGLNVKQKFLHKI